MSQRILVTGAAGFVGFHLARRLVRSGRPVLGIDSLNNYYDPSLKHARLSRLVGESDFQFRKLDIADRGAIERLFAEESFDCVIHLAAQAGVRYSLENPHAYADSNLTGFVNVLECCRQSSIRHLIYASSSSVYGANAKTPFSEQDGVNHPVSLYAATKRANELMAHSYSHLYRIPTTGMRFFTVYGPWGRPDMAYYSFTKAIEAGRPIDVFNFGQLRRDFTYVDDVTEAIQRLVDLPPRANPAWNAAAPDPASSDSPYRIFNIGNQRPVAIGRFIEILEECLGKKAVLNYRPMQPGDVLETAADVSALHAACGYQPTTSLEVGLEKFVHWYRDYHGTGVATRHQPAAKTSRAA